MSDVLTDSPAAMAGFQIGDRLVELEGADCASLISVKDLIEAQITASNEVEVRVKRKSMFGDDETVTLVLKSVPGWSGPGLTGLALKSEPIF